MSVVKGGEVLLAKGYGFADLEKGTPVSAHRTMFRIASVTKLFTWTAIMQLAERGKLNLDVDVNEYLETFQIPAEYPEPITLTHLMTHTAGFDQPVGVSAEVADDIRPLEEVLRDNLPARVRPPGEFSAYSNYGAALAGHVVEAVSGMSFDQYIEENILKPLGMNSTTTRQPVPPQLADNVALGYTYAKGTYQPRPFFYHQLSPAISASTTATDIARFMIAHLQNGRYQDVRILEESTAQEMHRQILSHDPRVSGWTYGFMEMKANDQHLIWHRGSWSPQFYTLLALLPEHEVGLFVSYNGPGGGVARLAFLRAFLDRCYSTNGGEILNLTDDHQIDLRRFTGGYRTTSSTYATFQKLDNLHNQIDLSLEADGSLLMRGFGDPQHWVAMGALVFRAVGREPFFSRHIIFHEDERGRITHFFLSNDPRFAFERIPWYETTLFTFGLLGVCAVFFLSAMIWPIGFLIHRRRGIASAPCPTTALLARLLTGSVCVLNLVFIQLLVFSDIQNVQGYGVPLALVAVLYAVLLTAASAMGSTVLLVLVWIRRYWSLAARLHYTLVTLAAVAFVWWLQNWRLLGPQS